MTGLPSKSQILAWIAEHPGQTAKRYIAKAFGIKGAARIDLKRLLKELEAEGQLDRRRGAYRDPDSLPPVSVLRLQAPDDQGDLFAKPMEWQGTGPEPRVLYLGRDSDPALAEGDRILCRLTPVEGEDHQYTARLIRRIGTNPIKILGIFRKGAEGGRIVPIDKGADKEWLVPAGATHDARDGELVEAEQSGPKGRLGLPRARITDRLGDPQAPKAVSLIAIHQHGIPDAFPDDAIAEADQAKPAGLSGRVDLRDLPLITIDPSDARDHDDAVFAEPDPDTEGGHIVWVAIADVAHYVPPGSQLDRAAWERGNSTYFPDRVVPMLPDRLSGDLCSLHEGVDRACIAVRLVLGPDGQLTGHQFHRALMRSAASLSYEAAQAAIDGHPDDKTGPLLDPVLKPLYAAWHAALKAREKRQPLALDLPERRIVLSETGQVTSVRFRDRLDAHRLIEEFMVLANVAAGQALTAKKMPLLYRNHEEPSQEKLDALRETAQSAGLTLAKGQVLKTGHLNRLLDQAAGTDVAELINITTLRSMTQAYYGPQNFGHFGLALGVYAHFTSPIRRYADLVVHRGLIRAHGWGKDGLDDDGIDRLEATGSHISQTERRSMVAERDTTDRYLAAYLSERIGNTFGGRISGIARFGVFIKLDENGADGLVPMRALGDEYFHYDAQTQSLMGADSGREITIGMPAQVRIAEAVPVTGGLLLELLELDGKEVTPGPERGRGGPRYRSGRGGKSTSPKRAASRAKKAAAAKASKKKGKRKVVRKRR